MNRQNTGVRSKIAKEIELAARNRHTLVFFSWPMQILFAISIVCFFVLLWAAVAISRRIRAAPSIDPRGFVGKATSYHRN